MVPIGRNWRLSHISFRPVLSRPSDVPELLVVGMVALHPAERETWRELSPSLSSCSLVGLLGSLVPAIRWTSPNCELVCGGCQALLHQGTHLSSAASCLLPPAWKSRAPLWHQVCPITLPWLSQRGGNSTWTDLLSGKKHFKLLTLLASSGYVYSVVSAEYKVRNN